MRLREGAHGVWSGNEKVRFLIVGGYNSVFGYVTFAAVYWFLHEEFHYIGLAIAAHFIAVTNSFLTQRHFVFQSTGSWTDEFLRFHVGYLAMLPIGIGLLAFFYEVAGFPMLLAQGGALLVGVVLSYLMSRYLTFAVR